MTFASQILYTFILAILLCTNHSVATVHMGQTTQEADDIFIFSPTVPLFANLCMYNDALEAAARGQARAIDIAQLTTDARALVMKGELMENPFVSFLQEAAYEDARLGRIGTHTSVASFERILDQSAVGGDRMSALTLTQALFVIGAYDFDGIMALLQAVVRLPMTLLEEQDAFPYRQIVLHFLLRNMSPDTSHAPAFEQHMKRLELLNSCAEMVQSMGVRKAVDLLLKQYGAHHGYVDTSSDSQ
ncbi:MAG: hypothetical protein C0514_03205 [Candidatus Puniceispirillum sp.]|nr:hypothetical protein [Candidatus Puniceispirillum sp.]